MFNQELLVDKINSFKTLPHSIVIIGDYGSGKTEMSKYIAERFNLEYKDITNDISLESISSIYDSSVQTLYAIDAESIKEKQQNIVLKIFEEPTETAYFILMVSNKNFIINTLLTRAYEMEMIKCSRDSLAPFVTLSRHQDLILNVCTTVGQVDIANHTDLDSLTKLCEMMLEKLGTAAYFNVLSIADKINFDDEFNKYDLKLFCKVLRFTILKNVFKYDNDYLKKFNSSLIELEHKILLVSNKRQCVENFLTDLWRFAHDYHRIKGSH